MREVTKGEAFRLTLTAKRREATYEAFAEDADVVLNSMFYQHDNLAQQELGVLTDIAGQPINLINWVDGSWTGQVVLQSLNNYDRLWIGAELNMLFGVTDRIKVVYPEILVSGTTDFGRELVVGGIFLDGVPIVTIIGAHAGDFTVTTQPTATTVRMGITDTFKALFNPSAMGTRKASISIVTNDPDANPLLIPIRGVGLAPEINVTGSAAFGNVYIDGGYNDITYTIQNLGNSDLNLTGTPRVAVGGAHAADFVVTAQPSTPVAGGGTSTFAVRFDPIALGARTATLSIANNDADENPYTIDLTGAGIPNQLLTGMYAEWFANNIGVADGALVTTFPDSSGNARDLIEKAPNTPPTFDEVDPTFNNHSSVHARGLAARQLYHDGFAITHPSTVYIVASKEGAGGFMTMSGHDYNNNFRPAAGFRWHGVPHNRHRVFLVGGTTAACIAGTGFLESPNLPTVLQPATVLAVRFNGANTKAFVNGVEVLATTVFCHITDMEVEWTDDHGVIAYVAWADAAHADALMQSNSAILQTYYGV